MLSTLGITHVLNISDSCPNYFEESNCKFVNKQIFSPYLCDGIITNAHPAAFNLENLTYLHLDFGDTQDTVLSHVFPEIFHFIQGAIAAEDDESEIEETNLAEMTYPNSTATILLNYETNTSKINMNAQELQYSRIQRHVTNIRSGSGSEKRIFIHCAMGKSRSATAFIMYLMRRFSLTMEDAYQFCLNHRQATEPNDGFRQQLQRFEQNGRRFDNEL